MAWVNIHHFGIKSLRITSIIQKTQEKNFIAPGVSSARRPVVACGGLWLLVGPFIIIHCIGEYNHVFYILLVTVLYAICKCFRRISCKIRYDKLIE
jgi:hypothetical protein